MFGDVAKTLLEFLKLTPRFLVALGLAAGLLLFAPDPYLQRIGLTEYVQKYRFVLGFTLVISITLLMVYAAMFVLNSLKRWWRRRRFNRQLIERLQNLTEDEKQILRYYVAENTRSNMLRYDDGVVQGLVEVGIIYQSTSMGNLIEGFAHNISPVAWDYLHTHPDVLVGNTRVYRTDKRDLFR